MHRIPIDHTLRASAAWLARDEYHNTEGVSCEASTRDARRHRRGWSDRGGFAVAPAHANAIGHVDFFSGGNGSARWSHAHATIDLSVPAGGDYAGFSLSHFSSTAPSEAPTLATDNYAAGSPRLVMEFSDGGVLFGYPSPFAQWEVRNCPGYGGPLYTSYEAALAGLGDSCGGDVAAVYVVADASGGAPENDSITSFVYDGTSYVG